MDFEELLSQPPKSATESNAETVADTAQTEAHSEPSSTDQPAEGAGAGATAAGRLRQVLSIIEEDANGPLSKAAKMGTVSRPVSSVYDAGPDPFADHTVEGNQGQAERSSERETEGVSGGEIDEQKSSSTEDTATRHRRTSSKLSID